MTRIANGAFVRLPDHGTLALAARGAAPLDSPLTLALLAAPPAVPGAGARRASADAAPRTSGAAGPDARAQVQSPAQRDAAAAIGLAFVGSPETFLARVALELRRTRSAVQEMGLRVETSAADGAEKAREAAEAAATRAAREATSFLGLGKTFDTIAQIAGVVASVATTALTLGAAAPIAAGVLLMTFGPQLVDCAVDAGLCPPELREAASTALKLTGAVMLATATLGAGAAAIGAVALEAAAKHVVDAVAAAFDLSPEVSMALQLTLSVGAGVLGAVAGGAAASTGAALGDGTIRAATTVGRDVARVTRAAAEVGSATTDGLAAVSEHDAAHARADATAAAATRDTAHEDADNWLDGLRATLKAYGRAMRVARQTHEARGEALRAATRQLA